MRVSVISWMVCVLALIGLIGWLGSSVFNVSPRGEKASGRALIGGAFSLTDGNGNTVTDRNFRGQYMLVYFGFTHCPDICPTGLLLIQNALEELGERGSEITPIFITLDPERDTPEVMQQYVKHFGERVVGLTGNAAQVKQAADAYKVYYSKVEAEHSEMGYMIDHSSFIYLMGPDGSYITHFPHSISQQALIDGLAAKVKP